MLVQTLMVFRPISDEIWGIGERAQRKPWHVKKKKSWGFLLPRSQQDVAFCLVCRSQRGHSYHIKNNRGRPSHGGTCSSSQRSASSDCSGINPHTAAHRSAETKSSTLMQPLSPALIPPSSEPGRHQPPRNHKGTKGRRRGGEQKTKTNRKKKHTGGHKEVKSLGAFTGRSWGESGSKALAFRKAPSVYVRDAGR